MIVMMMTMVIRTEQLLRLLLLNALALLNNHLLLVLLLLHCHHFNARFQGFYLEPVISQRVKVSENYNGKVITKLPPHNQMQQEEVDRR